MNLKSLRVFVHVMEEGTLSRASQRLNLSPPAASRLLNILEMEFGNPLFFREKKRLIPTPEGDLFYPEALRILASIDGIPAFFAQMRKDAKVPLRIMCHPRIDGSLVLPAIIRLSQHQPDLQVKLEVTPRRSLGRRIAKELFDVGVGTLPIPSEDLKPEHLCQSSLHVVVPKDHPLADRRVVSTAELMQWPYIALDSHTLIRKIVDRELLAEGMTLEPSHEVSMSSSSSRLVLAGLGFTFSDPMAIESEMKSKLSFVPWERAPLIEIGVFLPNNFRRHYAVDDFVSCLRETVRDVLGHDRQVV